MSKNTISSTTVGGFTATVPTQDREDSRVAPTVRAEEHNALRISVFPFACWKLEDIRFEFDSSILLPEVKQELAQLHALRQRHPGAPLSIFGHADPTGKDEYNKRLSGRRAMAVYALLVRDTKLWENLHHSDPVAPGDKWGIRAVQIMLRALGQNPGPADETLNEQTRAATRSFQEANGLEADGNPGPKTRAVLFASYMDLLAGDLRMKPSEFLAKGADPDGKGDYQGCGEFNPVLVFSKEEEADFAKQEDKTERNQQNSPNRRVVAYLYRPGSQIVASRWPCPRALEGPDTCRNRFWSDGNTRRNPQALRREFPETEDTFGCRFYHRLTDRSPCENPGPPGLVTFVAGRLPSLFTLRRTFPKPTTLPMLKEVARRATEDPSLRIVIMGHTDNSGDDAVNQKVSLARAAAVSALLTGDAKFFRERFKTADPLEKWSWEEIQWMLSALEFDGDPLYVGVVDGHRGDVTLTAIESFQLVHDLRVNRRMDEETLSKLIEKYLDLVGTKRPTSGQIELIGGGSWHKPVEFGPGGKPLAGPEFSQDLFVGFRRVEIFLSNRPVQPPASACPKTKHENCPVYTKWCEKASESLKSDLPHTWLIRVTDGDYLPVEGVSARLFRHPVEGEPAEIGSFSTSKFGLIRLKQEPGHVYTLRVTAEGHQVVAGFHLHPDEGGGLTVRIPTLADRFGLLTPTKK